MSRPDTIAAIGTAPGEGAIGMVRMSGPEALSTLLKTFRTPGGQQSSAAYFPSHLMRYGFVVDPSSGTVLDEVLAVYMQAPRTYTREDVVEIYGHGGTLTCRRLLDAVVRGGVRVAEPGEFTKRAFLNGRINLQQAEAVIDVIRARTDRSLRSALSALSGLAEETVGRIRQELLDLTAHVEAWIDFPEEDIPVGDRAALAERENRIEGALQQVLDSFAEGKALREGLGVALVGRPNVGKSSLLNALLREDRAIVTPVPGTTRDTIEESFSLAGIPLRLIDTAGIREAEDGVEAEGVRRSRAAMEQADLILLVVDGSEPLTGDDLLLLEVLRTRRGVVVLNKTDLPGRVVRNEVKTALGAPNPVLEVSAKFGTGMEELRCAIEAAALGEPAAMETPLISRARHREALERACEHLHRFRAGLDEGREPELLAVDLRDALDWVGVIAGSAVADDVLEVVFREFCVGK